MFIICIVSMLAFFLPSFVDINYNGQDMPTSYYVTFIDVFALSFGLIVFSKPTKTY